MATTFSEHARERLLDLYNKHDHEVGRVLREEHPELYKAFTPTDCITYALNVITYAYKKTNNDEAARQVKKLGAHGHRVSEYLVTKQRWVGVYISPDVTHPLDASREHTFANQLVTKTCTYYQVPIKYRAVNYNPTPKGDPNFQKLNKKAPETPLNQVDLEALAKVPFGFGISRGGMHTWLVSSGSVYEVHWDGIGADLYERTPLEVFGWLSGAIVVPPDQANQLSLSAQTCRRR